MDFLGGHLLSSNHSFTDYVEILSCLTPSGE